MDVSKKIEQVRLQKYMASCGVASRRKCEEIILQGRVEVNGCKIDVLGTKINPKTDTIAVDGKNIYPEEEKVYILLNKPVGYVTTVHDPYDRPKVLDLLCGITQRIYPVGRLDSDTSGLLILTNDGEFTHGVTHPRHKIEKTYRVTVLGLLPKMALKRLQSGVDIGDYMTAPAWAQVERQSQKYTELILKISEGKNRQIRRMFDALSHPVLKLERIAIGGISTGRLENGKWRFLTEKEIRHLKEAIGYDRL